MSSAAIAVASAGIVENFREFDACLRRAKRQATVLSLGGPHGRRLLNVT